MKYDFFGRLITNAKYFAVLLSKCDYKETTKSILLHKQADSFLSLSETLACELLTKNSKVILARSLILERPLAALTTIPFGVQKHTCGFLQCPAGPLWLTLLKCLNTGKIFN